MIKTIYIQYKQQNVLQNAYSVLLGDANNTFGIKKLDGTVVVAPGTSVGNPSTGIYQYEFNCIPNTTYVVSWQIQSTSTQIPKYVQQEIGPFTDDTQQIRAVADYRGSFTQSSNAIAFLKVTDIDGNPITPDSITVNIIDPSGNPLVLPNQTNIPELVQPGFYAYEWAIQWDALVGEYLLNWTYTVNTVVQSELQKIVISAAPYVPKETYYAGVHLMYRQALTYLITSIQSIPVYKEPAKQSRDNKTFEFTFPRWNQVNGTKIYRNDQIVSDGITIDYFKGKVIFDAPLTQFDKVEASYNFRYLSDEQLDSYINNSLQNFNIYPPQTVYRVYIPEIWTPTILYGAAIDAIRNFMLAIQFVENQLIFGNAEAAGRVFSNLEALKKNYEETYNKALENKKKGPYRGRTKMMISDTFALPGSRSRWFRYLFSGG